MDSTGDDNPPRSAPVRRPDRLAREAEALRANLRKRKQQERQRAEAGPGVTPTEQRPPRSCPPKG